MANNRGLVNNLIAFIVALVAVIILDALISFMFEVSLFERVYQRGIGNLVKSLLWIALAIFILGIIGFGFARGEDNWKFKKIKDKYKVVLWNKGRVGLNRAINKYVPGCEKVWITRWLVPDYLQEILKENKVILFSLSNYLKRMYIMYGKMDQVVVARNVSEQMTKQIGHHTDIKELEREIWLCRNFTPNGKEEEFLDIGWFPQNRKICEKIIEINNFLREYLLYVVDPRVPVAQKNFSKYQTRTLELRGEISTAIGKLKVAHDFLEDRATAYGAHQPIKAWMYLVLDQSNPYGNFEHEYKFVNRGVELSDGTKTQDKTEVNQYKEVLRDKHEGSEKIRFVKDPRKIYPHDNPMQTLSWVLQDWEGFIRNLRFGEYRYYSKSLFDYLAALSTKENDPAALGRPQFGIEGNIKTTRGFKSASNPAFDRRALVNPGNMAYPGRRRFDQGLQDIQRDPQKDENPALSSFGMSLFIPALTSRDINEIAGMEQQLNSFLRDTGVTVESHLDAHEAIGPLGAGIRKTEG